MTEAAIAALIEGARRWCADAAAPGAAKPVETVQAVVIAAPDLGVDPARLCGAAPGALYVVRIPGALVPPASEAAAEPEGASVAAALEYGVGLAGARDIIVLGHSECGLIGALADEGGVRARHLARAPALRCLAALAAPAVARTAAAPGSAGDRRLFAAMELVRLSLENLMSHDWLLARILAGEVALHGWCLDAAAPALWLLDAADDEFRPA